MHRRSVRGLATGTGGAEPLAISPIHQLVQSDIKPLGSLIAMSLAEIFEKLINSLAVA